MHAEKIQLTYACFIRISKSVHDLHHEKILSLLTVDFLYPRLYVFV